MGQKVNPVGLRIGVNRGWNANWYANNKDFSAFLKEDVEIRRYLDKALKEAMVSHITVSRTKGDQGGKVEIVAYVARPGVFLGQDGTNTEKAVADLKRIVKSGTPFLKVLEVKEPDLDATLVAKWIASELENRQSFRSTQKKALQRMRKAGAAGCKTQCQGRLGGAEIARREGYKEGVVPLETYRADIDYAAIPAHTAYGRIGVKVWICRSAKKVVKKSEPTEGGRPNASAKTR